MLRETHFQGPMPPPDHVNKYEETLPGAARILFDEFQAQASHRRSLEREEKDLEREERKHAMQTRGRAQWMAFLLCLMALGTGAFFAYFTGQAWAGISIVAAVLLPVGGISLWSHLARPRT